MAIGRTVTPISQSCSTCEDAYLLGQSMLRRYLLRSVARMRTATLFGLIAGQSSYGHPEAVEAYSVLMFGEIKIHLNVKKSER